MEKLTIRDWTWVLFECHAGLGDDVFVGGTFNKWKPSRFDKLRHRGNGTYKTLLKLRKGRHEYNFMVNGVWQALTEDRSAEG